MKTVGVGFDDSPSAHHALAWAVALWDAEVLAVNAFQRPSPGTSAGIGPGSLEKRQKMLELKTAAEFETESIRAIVAQGEPHDVLCGVSETHNVDLVVVGRNEVSANPGRSTVGTLAEHIVGQASVPCAVIPTTADVDRGTVVIGVDASAGSRSAVLWLAANAEALATDIVAVHVPQPTSPDQAEREPGVLTRRLDGWVEPLRTTRFPVSTVLTDETGDVAGRLVELAAKLGNRLLIVGIGATDQLVDAHRGRVAETTLQRAVSLPLVVVPVSSS